MNKKFFLLVGTVLLAASLFTSCELIKDLVDIEFETGYTEITITINPREAGPIVFTEEYLQSELEKEIKDNGGDISNLKDVTVNEITLELVSGEPDLNALDYVNLYIGTPSLGNTLIGSVENIADNQVTVDLAVSEANLKKILSETEYLVLINGALDQDIEETTVIVVKINYSVVVSP